ncbi:MAG TPA: hypothetical protein VMU73_01660, partial [Gaiellaceae bacterium]|nr:hypothetical protein [Gaiellaceae bacterium]
MYRVDKRRIVRSSSTMVRLTRVPHCSSALSSSGRRLEMRRNMVCCGITGLVALFVLFVPAQAARSG